MGTNSGASGRRHAYHALVKAGVDNAMAKGYLFGHPLDKIRRVAIIPSRGKVIWPDPPKGFMRHWWRAHQTGRFLGEPIPQRS